jgi:hypothetical protein
MIALADEEADPVRRNRALAQAERILLTELPVIPVYSYVTQNLVAPRLGGFGSNVLNEHDPKHWFWKDDRTLAQQRRQRGGRLERVHAFGPAEGKYSPAQQRVLAEHKRRKWERKLQASEQPDGQAPAPQEPRR